MQELLDGVIKQIEDYEKGHQTAECNYYEPYASYFMTSGDFLNYILNICNSLSREQIKPVLAYNYTKVFDIFEDGTMEEREKAGQILANANFLIGLMQVFADNSFSDDDVRFISKLYINAVQHYDEFKPIYSLYYSLAKIVNFRQVTLLKAFLDEESAVLISASSNVSYNPSLCVGYVNFALGCIVDKKGNMSAESIARSTYDILIDNDANNLTSYFVYTVTQANVRKEFKDAICSIVENYPMYTIGVMINSAMMLPNLNEERITKSKLQEKIIGLNEKFPKITHVIEYIISNLAF